MCCLTALKAIWYILQLSLANYLSISLNIVVSFAVLVFLLFVVRSSIFLIKSCNRLENIKLVLPLLLDFAKSVQQY